MDMSWGCRTPVGLTARRVPAFYRGHHSGTPFLGAPSQPVFEGPEPFGGSPPGDGASKRTANGGLAPALRSRKIDNSFHRVLHALATSPLSGLPPSRLVLAPGVSQLGPPLHDDRLLRCSSHSAPEKSNNAIASPWGRETISAGGEAPQGRKSARPRTPCGSWRRHLPPGRPNGSCAAARGTRE
jgi:hypothetical protein